MKQFIIDNQNYTSTLDDIIEDNDLMLDEELEIIESLEIGEKCFIGIVEVKRIN